MRNNRLSLWLCTSGKQKRIANSSKIQFCLCVFENLTVFPTPISLKPTPPLWESTVPQFYYCTFFFFFSSCAPLLITNEVRKHTRHVNASITRCVFFTLFIFFFFFLRLLKIIIIVFYIRITGIT